MAIFPGEPGLAGNIMSPFWILLELRMVEMVVTTWSYKAICTVLIKYNQINDCLYFILLHCIASCTIAIK